MAFPEVKAVADRAWGMGFAARLEEGLVMRVYGGDVYLMICYRDTNGGHRFQEANGCGHVFRAHEFEEFLEFLSSLSPVPAPPQAVRSVSYYARQGGAS
jgi:hypothetical protein